jgi:4-amino-4-deoxy-L-arabinose transferase-like glycosyltransferase
MDVRRWTLGAIVLLSILARVAVMWPTRDRPMEDPDNYLPLARSLAEGRGFEILGKPTAYRPPLYPLILAPGVAGLGAFKDWWVRGLHLVLGAGTTALTALAARRWGLSDRRVAVASLIVALDPVLVVQSRAVMTETFAAFLMAAALASVADARETRGSILAGLALGLAALCRPSTLPAAGLMILASLAGPGRFRRRLVRASQIAMITLLALLPWGVRNLFVFGELVLTTTHGGYTLALANNPEYYDAVLNSPRGRVWSGPSQRSWTVRISQKTTGMSEPDADRTLRREAIRLMRERPLSFLKASAARLARFWGLAPSESVYPVWLRAATAVWTIPLWVLLGIGTLRRESWRWPRVSALMVIVALTGVHTVFWTDLRMRAPIVPAIALIAASAGKLSSRRTR